MIMFILNFPGRKMKAGFKIKVSFLAVFFCGLFIPLGYPEQVFSVNAVDSLGEWRREVVTGREVVTTSKALAKSEIQVYIEEPGKYQLFAYIHHNWRKVVPCIYAEVANDGGVLYQGYHRIENIWYLDRENPGRWFMVSLTQGSFWELPRGRVTIRFWADAKAAVWDDSSGQMEGSISVDKFFLVPVWPSGKDSNSAWLVYPEAGNGNWSISDYQSKYATNLAKSVKRGQTLSIPVKVPSPGNYRLWAAVFSPEDNRLGITFRDKFHKRKAGVGIKGKDTWSEIMTGPVYLNKGECRIVLEHLGQGEILVDYLILFSGFAGQ